MLWTRSHQRVPRSRSAQRAARQCWRRLNHRVGSFFSTQRTIISSCLELICDIYIWNIQGSIFYIQGWELMKKVGEDPSHLEDLTGLTALMQVRQIVSPIMLLKGNKNIDQLNFQDTSLMEGVIDLADDDCISFSSSCDWTVVSKMSHAYPSKIFLFILSKHTLFLNAVFLAYCDMIFDMRLWTNCTEARLTIVWPLLDRRPCAKSIQKVFSLPCNDISAMT